MKFHTLVAILLADLATSLTVMPTAIPTRLPTDEPSAIPSGTPTSEPSAVPSGTPTSEPSTIPTSEPNTIPKSIPTDEPNTIPSGTPTSEPSAIPSGTPTIEPSAIPASEPNTIPTRLPTDEPSTIPSSTPTSEPSLIPTGTPTNEPSIYPTLTNCMAWNRKGDPISGMQLEVLGHTAAMSSDGTIIAVAARTFDRVRIYNFNSTNSTWDQLGDDLPSVVETANGTGSSIALSSNGYVVATGTSSHSNDTGRVRVFDFVDTRWSLRSVIDGEAFKDEFGTSIAMSSVGDTIAIGTTGNDLNGSVRVLVDNDKDNEWVQLGSDLTGNNGDSNVGTSVAISGDGNIVAFGADNRGFGYAHVFEWSATDNDWTSLGSVMNSEPISVDIPVPFAMSSSGEILAIGAINHVRVFARENDPTWVQRGSDITVEASSLALSSDGSVIVISDLNAEHVSVYFYDDQASNADWSQRGDDIDGTSLGVAISSNGTAIVTNDLNTAGLSNGEVRVNEWKSGSCPSAVPSTIPTTHQPSVPSAIPPSKASAASLLDTWMLVPVGTPMLQDHTFVMSYNISNSLSTSDIGNMIQTSVLDEGCESSAGGAGYSLNYTASNGQLDVKFTIISDSIDTNNIIFTPPKNNTLGRVGVCVSVSLYNKNEEIIRRKVIININLDLTTSIIVDFDTLGNNPGILDPGTISYGVVAEATQESQQGIPFVSVRIEVKDNATLITSIDSFVFSNDDGCVQDTRNLDNALTEFENCENRSFCSFRTILKACFFSNLTNTVSGNGTVSLKFNDLRNRRLQNSISDEASNSTQIDFGISFEVSNTNSASSGITFAECTIITAIVGAALASWF